MKAEYPSEHNKQDVIAIFSAILVLFTLWAQFTGIKENYFLASGCLLGIFLLVRNLIYFSPLSYFWNIYLKRTLSLTAFILCVLIGFKAFKLVKLEKESSEKESRVVVMDFVKEITWSANPKPVQINTPVPGKKTNLTIQTTNEGPTGASLIFFKNGRQIFKPYLAPGGGQSETKTFLDEDGKTVYSYLAPQEPTSFIVNGTFRIFDK